VSRVSRVDASRSAVPARRGPRGPFRVLARALLGVVHFEPDTIESTSSASRRGREARNPGARAPVAGDERRRESLPTSARRARERVVHPARPWKHAEPRKTTMRKTNRTKTKSWAVIAAVGALSALPLAACNDGPMENAGEEIDEAADEVEDEVEDVVD
jgi:hypothetical protein